jgi:flagellar basal-body rod modification protein FlgD
MSTSAITAQTGQELLAQLNAAAGTATKSANSVSDAQNRFLTLLTTQLKNQDPLNPMDNAQVTSQLAQISTVDGIERLNEALKLLTASADESQSLQAASLVGHGVLVPGANLRLTEAQAVGGVELFQSADNVQVVIKDANGLVVRNMDLGAADAGVSNFVWDGTTDSGEQAVDGLYSISVSATVGQDAIDARALELGVVQSITKSNGATRLNVGDAGSVSMQDIRQIL